MTLDVLTNITDKKHILGIQDNHESMMLFTSLHEDVNSIKSLIQEKIPSDNQGFILTTIGFFATIKPKIAHELVGYVQTGEVEKFAYLVYQHIYDAVAERKKHLESDDPIRAQIDKAMDGTHKLEKMMLNSKVITWSDIPSAPTELVPQEWIGIKSIP